MVGLWSRPCQRKHLRQERETGFHYPSEQHQLVTRFFTFNGGLAEVLCQTHHARAGAVHHLDSHIQYSGHSVLRSVCTGEEPAMCQRHYNAILHLRLHTVCPPYSAAWQAGQITIQAAGLADSSAVSDSFQVHPGLDNGRWCVVLFLIEGCRGRCRLGFS